MSCACAQTDILDHKEQQAGVATRRLQALDAQLDALRAEMARSSAQVAALTVRPGTKKSTLVVQLRRTRCARSCAGRRAYGAPGIKQTRKVTSLAFMQVVIARTGRLAANLGATA